ncbi:hypothetical protein IWQ61_001169 [Dispira simplex]|nr:hypothetical protein IWQ61_001169 [Dispira simplex]
MEDLRDLGVEGLKFSDLPSYYQNALTELQQEYDDGDITHKGFEKKRRRIVLAYLQGQQSATGNTYSELGSREFRSRIQSESSGEPTSPLGPLSPMYTPSVGQHPFFTQAQSPGNSTPVASPRPSGLDFDILLNNLSEPSMAQPALSATANSSAGFPSRPGSRPRASLSMPTTQAPLVGSTPLQSYSGSPTASAFSPVSPVERPYHGPIATKMGDPGLPRPNSSLAPPIPPRSRQRSMEATSPGVQPITPSELDQAIARMDRFSLTSPTIPSLETDFIYDERPQHNSTGDEPQANAPNNPPPLPPKRRLPPTAPPKPTTTTWGASIGQMDDSYLDSSLETWQEPSSDSLQSPTLSYSNMVLSSPTAEHPPPHFSDDGSGRRESVEIERPVSPTRAHHIASASGLRVITQFDSPSSVTDQHQVPACTASSAALSPPPVVSPATPSPMKRVLRVANVVEDSPSPDTGSVVVTSTEAGSTNRPLATSRLLSTSNVSVNAIVPPIPVQLPRIFPMGGLYSDQADGIDLASQYQLPPESFPSYGHYTPAVTDGRPRQTSIASSRSLHLTNTTGPSPEKHGKLGALPRNLSDRTLQLAKPKRAKYVIESHAVAREIPPMAYSETLKFIMQSFPNLPSLLKYRAQQTPKALAFMSIDNKGKESTSITWIRLYQRAERIVKLLRSKGVVCKGDRVALIYRKSEVVDFLVAFYGCMLAGMCAVPMVATDSLAEMIDILNVTQTRLVLTTELNIKALTRDLAEAGVPAPGQTSHRQSSSGFPAGWPADVEWVKTNDLGGATVAYSATNPSIQRPGSSGNGPLRPTPSTASLSGGNGNFRAVGGPSSAAPVSSGLTSTFENTVQLGIHDLAYLEFSKSPNGELKGVQVTHGSLMQQCLSLTIQLSQTADDDLPAGEKLPNSTKTADSGKTRTFHTVGKPSTRSFDGPSPPTARVRNLDSGGVNRHSMYSNAADNSLPDGMRTFPRIKEKSGGSHNLRKTLGEKLTRGTFHTGSSTSLQHASRASVASDGHTGGYNGDYYGEEEDEPQSPRDVASTLVEDDPRQRDGLLEMDFIFEMSDDSQVFMVSLDPRQHLGLVSGGLLGVFGGHPTIFMNSSVLEIPGVWIHMLTKYKVTIAVADYHSLGSVLSSAIDEPDLIHQYSRKVSPDLCRLHQILVDTMYIDPDFHQQFHRAVLHPFGCRYKSIQYVQRRPVLTPVLSLPEHGSILLAVRNCFDDLDDARDEIVSGHTGKTKDGTGTRDPVWPSAIQRQMSISMRPGDGRSSVSSGITFAQGVKSGNQSTTFDNFEINLFARVQRAKDQKRSLSARYRDLWEFTLERQAMRLNRVVIKSGFSRYGHPDADGGEGPLGTMAMSNDDDSLRTAPPEPVNSTDLLMDRVIADIKRRDGLPESSPDGGLLREGAPSIASTSRFHPDRVKLYSFGRPNFLTNIVIVNPNTKELCESDQIGEIWIDCPALGAGFWALPKLSQAIFYARYRYYVSVPDPAVPGVTTLTEAISDQTFLRTGLMGTLINGCLLVFGYFEDRLQQTYVPPINEEIGRVVVSQGSVTDGDGVVDSKFDNSPVSLPVGGSQISTGSKTKNELDSCQYFYYRADLLYTIQQHNSLVGECTVFELFVNDTYLPVVLFETRVPEVEMPRLCDDVYKILVEHHQLFAYAICASAPDTLPRAYEYGRRVVNATLCQARFEKGAIALAYSRISFQRLALNIPTVESLGAMDASNPTDPMDPNAFGRWLQHTSLELSEPAKDDRTGRDLQGFQTILDILHWRATVMPSEIALVSFESKKRATLANVNPVAQVPWGKLLHKVALLANYLIDKHSVRSGDHVIVMLPVGLELFYTIQACFAIGAVAIPLALPETKWIEEDLVLFVESVRQFNVHHMLIDAEVELLLRNRPYSRYVRSLNRINVSKAPKNVKSGGFLGPKTAPKLPAVRSSPTHVSLIFACPPGPDQVYPQFVKLSHSVMLSFAQQLKSDFQMPSTHPVLATTRCYFGYSFLQLILLGIYNGAPTVLFSYNDFWEHPYHWFELLQRYKIKDALATYPMFERAVSRMNQLDFRAFTMHNVRNLSVVLDDRAIPAYYTSLAGYFMSNRLEETAINNIYFHPMNPLISTRAYMGIKPATLRICLSRLRRGRVVALTGEDRDSPALLLQDSGKVTSNAMVAIVNPLTRRICMSGEVGEIWVYSMSNAIGYAHRMFSGAGPPGQRGRLTEVNTLQVMDHIEGGDPQYAYLRTGDLGFLYIDPASGTGVVNGVPEEPLLYVLGRMSNTFDIHGLTYFVMDAEASVEKCHPLLENNGTVIFRTTVKEPSRLNFIDVLDNQPTLRPTHTQDRSSVDENQPAVSQLSVASNPPTSEPHGATSSSGNLALQSGGPTTFSSTPFQNPWIESEQSREEHHPHSSSLSTPGSNVPPLAKGSTATSETKKAKERLVVVISVLRYTETDICHVANLAPLVTNVLLEEHHLVVDEIMFIPASSIPTSRTHEKRRSWVKRIYEEGPINVLSRHIIIPP